jgi:hypothetical protein
LRIDLKFVCKTRNVTDFTDNMLESIHKVYVIMYINSVIMSQSN